MMTELSIQNNLEKIKPSDYSNLPDGFKEWLEIKEELPQFFWEKVKDVNREENLSLMILKIKEILLSFYREERDSAKSFKDSRFTSLADMINRHMATCGSSTKIIGTILRKFNIPTKFVHGILASQKRSFIKRVLLKERHAWLEIYVPETKSWLSFDVTQKDLLMYKDAEKIKEYHDWGELKSDYEKGNF